MKKIYLLLIALIAISGSTYAQLNSIKKFDFAELENKVLYLPVFEANPSFVKKMLKKGNFSEIEEADDLSTAYNEMLEEAMALSAYDATPYEIRDYDSRKLFKSKNEEAILLSFRQDEHGNTTAMLIVTGPKRRTIANTIINGLDISYAPDFRLMINMLNYSLNTAVELEEEGNKSFSAQRNKYKQSLVNFVDSIDDKTFYAPKYNSKDYKKYDKKNQKIKEAMRFWRICESEIVPSKEIEELRANSTENCFYWRSFPIYTSIGNAGAISVSVSVPIYSLNFFFTCDGDLPIFYWYGGKNLKPNAIENAQDKMVKKAQKYKEQLSKE